MTPTDGGLLGCAIDDTPVAVLDFETTGMSPGYDRVVEVSVVRIDPGGLAELVFDTLVNPGRRVAATHVHGITDRDVIDAPRFELIAGRLLQALAGSVVAAYNVYFDLPFLDFELRRAGVCYEFPHLCLMYLRPMLGIGVRCRLSAACRAHGIAHTLVHTAAPDAVAAAGLWPVYRRAMARRDVRTFGDLAVLKPYKFV
ncbi:MAG TPA: 3'-5' exonuclease, partial [Gemmataceae bacterium]|nr:3'-5' exonuclease [Gemmataceae bacterium]